MKRLKRVDALRTMREPKVAFQLRLDETAHQKVRIIAEKELRSLNAQIEYFIYHGIAEYEKKQGKFLDAPNLIHF